MKQCATCQEEFADKFSFCPVDGSPLNGLEESPLELETEESIPAATAPSFTFAGAVAAEDYDDRIAEEIFDEDTIATSPIHPVGEFHVTIIEDRGLVSRLAGELRSVGHESRLTWPEFKSDPVGFTGRFLKAYSLLFWRFISQPNIAIAIVVSVVAMAVLAGGLVLVDEQASGTRNPWIILGLAAAVILTLIGLGGSLPNRYRSLEKAETGDSTNFAISAAVAVVFLSLVVGGFYMLDRYNNSKRLAKAEKEKLVLTSMVEIPDELKPEDEKEGTPGNAKGSGGGMKPKPEKPGGGGGGGDKNETKPPSQGKLPEGRIEPQIVVPRPEPPPPKALLPVTPTVRADPTLFPPDTRNMPYGMPNSRSTETSRGGGDGEGYGGGTGTGVGRGDGAGVGPGRDWNTGGGDPRLGGGGPGGDGGINYNRTFNPGEVTQKVRILSKPEPQYTEAARKNQVTGTVVIRAVFSASGEVTNIRTIRSLPDGLTEKAIAAARQIRFEPARKDGRVVSQYVQIEYNFNLY